MADEKNTTTEDQKNQSGPSDGPKADEKSTTKLSRFLPWGIIAAIILFGAGAGFGLGRIFAPRRQAASAQAAQPAGGGSNPDAQLLQSGSSAKTEQTWYYDLEPVVANLDEPGVTRYARVALTLEVESTLDEKKGAAFFDQKRPLLKHWLTLYMANQTVEDARGEKNLTRMQSQISDAFGESLFPSSKSPIKRVLFKEFAIQ